MSDPSLLLFGAVTDLPLYLEALARATIVK